MDILHWNPSTYKYKEHENSQHLTIITRWCEQKGDCKSNTSSDNQNIIMVETEFEQNIFLWNDINIYVWLRRKSMDTYVYITISAFNNSLKDLFSLSKAVHVTNFRNPYILHGKHYHIQLSQMSLQLPDSVWIHQTANNRLPQKAHLKFTLQNENKIRLST